MALAGLVGYDSDSSDEETSPQPTIQLTPVTQLQPTPPLIQPKPAEQLASIFRNRAPSTDDPAPKLNISDEDEPYRYKGPKVELSKTPTSTPVLDFALTAPIGQLINQAKVVSVNTDALKIEEGAISSLLPEPKVKNAVQESELKGLQSGAQRKRKKTKKIFALELEDYTEEEETPKPKKVQPSSGSGLFSLLPEPKHCTGVGSRINVDLKKRATPSASGTNKRFGGMMPRTIPKPRAAPAIESVDEPESSEDFFGFDKSVKERSELESNATRIKLDEFQPKVAPSARPVVYRPEGSGGLDGVTGDGAVLQEEQQMDLLEGTTEEDIPNEFKDLNSAEIIDVNQAMPSTEDWALKHLDYSDKPTASKKFDGGQQSKRKHQITYLAWQAKEKEAELQNNWANNKVNRHATQNKYGFR